MKLLPLLVALFLLAPAVSHAAPEPAWPADEFVDTMGHATHWGYTDTPYGFAYEQVKKLLGELGIRHVRDGWHERETDLYNSLGVKTTMIFGPQTSPADAVKLLTEHRDLTAMVEGPNEVDIFAGSAAYKGKTFPEGAKLYQNELYTALKAEPKTAGLGVIAPSTARAGSNRQLAPMTGADYVVMHSYAGGQKPSNSLRGDVNNNLTNAFSILGVGATLKPIVVTESGYHTALGSNVVIGGAQPGVSERAQAKYLPRHFAEYFNAGIVRTFTYEFLDEFPDYGKDEREAANAEACFGIVKRDLTPKPAYFTEKNLIALLSESQWNGTRWTTPRFAPAALDFALTGDVTNIHHTLLQKSNGDFYLLLWQEVSSFGTQTHRDIENPDVPVTLTLAQSVKPAVFRLSSVSKTAQLSGPTKTLTVDVPDEIVVVRLTPTVKRTPKLLAAPSQLAAKTTGDSATLVWKPVPKAAGYFVFRLGEFLGRTTRPAFADARLTPGVGYPYTVRAFDISGNVSGPAALVARTRAVFPDLIVTDITLSPANPKPGDLVTFTASVKNVGDAPSPAHVTVGVYFQVDGKGAMWSDTFHGPLAPGETKLLTASSGADGVKSWTATAGNHSVTALADDVNRINERDEGNNGAKKTVAIP